MDEMIIGGKGLMSRIAERIIRKVIKEKFGVDADISIEEMDVKAGDDITARLTVSAKIPGGDIRKIISGM